jgi:hypothetical protein
MIAEGTRASLWPWFAPASCMTMRRFLPDAPLTWMIGLGTDAVAAELAAEADRSISGAES